MTTDATIHNSPTGWVADHIQSYIDSNGAKGHHWHGADTLLITTRGRKTGRLHRTALIYGRHGANYVVVGSKGGAPANPAWYLNLDADPGVTVQVGPDTFEAVARTAAGDERQALWEEMARIWPDYEKYRERTAREIPVVVLEPVDA